MVVCPVHIVCFAIDYQLPSTILFNFTFIYYGMIDGVNGYRKVGFEYGCI